jgi:hypothetical protein
MKTLFATVAAAALLALAGPVSAQMVQPMQPAPMQTYQPMQQPVQTYQQPMPQPMQTYQQPMQQPTYTSGARPSWMQDDGSSSDHPTPMPGDRSGNPLNSQYRDGINVPPGMGLPADQDQR